MLAKPLITVYISYMLYLMLRFPLIRIYQKITKVWISFYLMDFKARMYPISEFGTCLLVFIMGFSFLTQSIRRKLFQKHSPLIQQCQSDKVG